MRPFFVSEPSEGKENQHPTKTTRQATKTKKADQDKEQRTKAEQLQKDYLQDYLQDYLVKLKAKHATSHITA